MRLVGRQLLNRLLTTLVVTALPAPSIAAGHSGAIGAAWIKRQRSSAELMIAKLDMTSFANSIGPRREAGKLTLQQYGFTQRRIFDDGWAYAKTRDDSWEVGIFVLTDGARTKQLCITDSAVGGGTYHSTIAIEARRNPDGLWRASRVLRPVTGCA